MKIKAKLKQIIDEEILEATYQKRKMSNIDKYSILRERKPTISQSMSVEKWIEVHTRKNRQTALDFLNKNIIVIDPNQSQSYIQKKMDKPESKSRRELADHTLLDKVQKQVKDELQQTLKKIKRVETNNEFNSLVDKIRVFLYKWEDEYGGPTDEILANNETNKSSKKYLLQNIYDDYDNKRYEENLDKKSIIPLCYKNLQDNRSLNQNFQQLGYTLSRQ
jgi:transcriptional regulator with PAS, ATPase and Fis domain